MARVSWDSLFYRLYLSSLGRLIWGQQLSVLEKLYAVQIANSRTQIRYEESEFEEEVVSEEEEEEEEGEPEEKPEGRPERMSIIFPSIMFIMLHCVPLKFHTFASKNSPRQMSPC